MDDLVKRLRGYGSNRCWPHGPACDCTQAADRIEALERQVKAADALADILVQVPSALNAAFGAGSEEREGGSARRQAKYMEKPEMLRREIPTALAAYRAAREADT